MLLTTCAPPFVVLACPKLYVRPLKLSGSGTSKTCSRSNALPKSFVPHAYHAKLLYFAAVLD